MAETRSKIVHVHLPEEEQFKTTLTAGNHELIADELEGVEGGNDQGPDPYDFLLMSLGSCTVMTIKMYAGRHSFPLENLYVELKHHKRHEEDCKNCEEERSKIDTIELELIMEGNLGDDQKNKLLNIAKKCPVYRTLTGDIKIEHSTESR